MMPWQVEDRPGTEGVVVSLSIPPALGYLTNLIVNQPILGFTCLCTISSHFWAPSTTLNLMWVLSDHTRDSHCLLMRCCILINESTSSLYFLVSPHQWLVLWYTCVPMCCRKEIFIPSSVSKVHFCNQGQLMSSCPIKFQFVWFCLSFYPGSPESISQCIYYTVELLETQECDDHPSKF